MPAAPWQTWLDRRHPQYGTYSAHWEFLRQAYAGGPEYLDANLFTFWRERPGDFAERRMRAHHYNASRKVVDLMNSYLWLQAPSRKTADLPEPLQAFWRDADREGHDINTVMMQQASPKTMTSGRIWAVIDKPSDTAKTRADQRDRRLFPYVTFYSPLDVLDARLDQGTLAWLLLRERVRDDDDPESSSGAVEDRYRLWTPTDWKLYKRVISEEREAGVTKMVVRAVLVDEGAHSLGEVPAVPIDHRAPESWFVSPSLLWEIAYLDRSIFNHNSLLDENLYDTTFSQFAIPYEALLPGQAEDEAGARAEARAAAITMSTHRAFTYSAKSPTAPAWLAPSPDPARVLMERIKGEIDELFRHTALSGEMATEVNTASGVSKEHEFRKLTKLLATQADNLEAAERAMLRLAAKWENIDPATLPADATDYPDEFDVKTLMDELAEIQEMQKASLPDVVVNEARKQAVQRRFGKLSTAKLEEFIKAIDAQVGIPVMDVEAAVDAAMRRRNGERAGQE